MFCFFLFFSILRTLSFTCEFARAHQAHFCQLCATGDDLPGNAKKVWQGFLCAAQKRFYRKGDCIVHEPGFRGFGKIWRTTVIPRSATEPPISNAGSGALEKADRAVDSARI